LKRAPFLGAIGATVLSGCGAQRGISALPGVAGFTNLGNANKKGPSGSAQLVPATPDAIPDAVLRSPLIGEAWRFAGTTAPAGWMLCAGQALKIADNPQLFGVLKTIAGGDGKTTFALPNPPWPVIIAVAGSTPSSPAALTQGVRRTSLVASLGAGAREAPPRQAAPPSAQLLAERRLITAQAPVRASAAVPVPAEVQSRMRDVRADTRTQALDVLSAANRARLLAAIDDTVGGRITQYTAVTQMRDSISGTEADALVRLNDAATNAFRSTPAPAVHREPQLEAAYFVVSIAFTPAQLDALGAQRAP